MKKNTMLSIFALFVVALITTLSFATAYRGNMDIKGPNYSEERHTLMQDAFDKLDYDRWHDLMKEVNSNSKVLSVIDKDNFDLFAKVHQAMIDEDYDTANNLRAELGLGFGHRFGDHTNFEHNQMKQGRNKGQNYGQHINNRQFIDLNKDGICDNLNN